MWKLSARNARDAHDVHDARDARNVRDARDARETHNAVRCEMWGARLTWRINFCGRSIKMNWRHDMTWHDLIERDVESC